MNYITFLTDLDSLFDTRMGTLFNLDSEKAVKISLNGYHTRTQDVFEGFGYKEFRDAYDKRDTGTLAASIVTKIFYLIIDFVNTTNANDTNKATPRVYVNTYPYRLSDEEKSIITYGLVHKTNKLVEIELIHKSPEEMSPTWMNEFITMVAMYDYNIWSEVHTVNGNFKNTLCTDLILFGPRVIFGEKELETDFKDSFLDMEKFCSLYYAIKFLPIADFSLMLNLNEKID